MKSNSNRHLKLLTGLKFLALAAVILCQAPSSRVWPRVAAQGPLTPPESRGRQIYRLGTSSSGREILAYLGESSLEVPGSAMPCANCHGFDGHGKPEAGVNPSGLSWDTLTKPYTVTRANGRQRPPYTERALALTITRGIDPGGNKLLNIMPRYQMSQEDIADLIVYLKRLGTDRDPGISETKIVIGTGVPSTGALAEMGNAVKAVIDAFFENVNSQGGIYNRRLELKSTETAETPAATRANLERFLKDEDVFAMTSTFVVGSERETIALMAQKEVPLIGPVTLYPQTGFPLNRQVFYLLSGIDEQARVLIDFAARKALSKTTRFAIVHSQTETNERTIEAIREQTRKYGLGAPEEYNYPAGRFDAADAVTKFRGSNRDVVFLLGAGDEVLSFMKEAEKLNWFPSIYLPGGFVGNEILNAPAGFNGQLFFAFPISPADQTMAGTQEFRALAEKYKLPAKHLAAQISAYSTAKILVEALKRAGKDVSREKLITTLEGFSGFETGLTPAISYGPNRRIGALGAYIVSVDLQKRQFVAASGWNSIN